MSLNFSYRHLYYFWVVAKEGGMARAALRLGMAVQTVSTQVRELEKSLGQSLLKPAGRGLVLTEAGRAALRQADQIFALGEQLPGLVRDAVSAPQVRLAVGISDGLLADLALHRLDVVLADRAAAPNRNLRLYNHPLGTSPLAWYAPPALLAEAQRDFPASLARVPVLLPTSHAAVRSRLDAWFERHAVRPRVVGEFEDNALLVTFGAAGMGVFPAPEWLDDKLTTRYDVVRVAACDGVDEQFFAIATEKKVLHPLVQRLLPALIG